ncbi:MAG: nicotinate phosphoribosyltransferase [Candidatus Omnitrophota bacterium]
MKRFHIATDSEILAGKVTDAYFVRTMEVLEQTDASKPVVMEIRAASLPAKWDWAVLAGVEELVFFMEGIRKPVDLFCLDEGTLFRAGDPVGYVIGDYKDICIYETAILGLLCQASGIATRAARCVKAAEGRAVLSFGARRLHPAVAPLVDRNAFIGGCVGFSSVITGELLEKNAAGTMPHSLILLVGDTVEASEMFDAYIHPKVPRISLIDTFNDEKFEAIQTAEAMGDKLYGVRVDTPASRRGNMLDLLKEIRWELDIRGHQKVRIVATGGIDEYKIMELNPVCYGYGVGTAISNAPVVDFAMDIVEIDGRPIAKRGKLSGRKRLLAQGNSYKEREIVFWKGDDPRQSQDLITAKTKQGVRTADSPPADRIREHVLQQLANVPLESLR